MTSSTGGPDLLYSLARSEARPTRRRREAWSCGAVWSARHPVKVEAAGSNPVRTAVDWEGPYPSGVRAFVVQPEAAPGGGAAQRIPQIPSGPPAMQTRVRRRMRAFCCPPGAAPGSGVLTRTPVAGYPWHRGRAQPTRRSAGRDVGDFGTASGTRVVARDAGAAAGTPVRRGGHAASHPALRGLPPAAEAPGDRSVPREKPADRSITAPAQRPARGGRCDGSHVKTSPGRGTAAAPDRPVNLICEIALSRAHKKIASDPAESDAIKRRALMGTGGPRTTRWATAGLAGPVNRPVVRAGSWSCRRACRVGVRMPGLSQLSVRCCGIPASRARTSASR